MAFTPTAGEVGLVAAIFNLYDTQKVGIITGDVAVRAFEGAHLAPAVLGQIWDLADDENNGWLARKRVAVALRLIGWAQKGETVREELIHKPGPLPTIDGIQAPLTTQSTGISLNRALSPSPSVLPAVPALSQQDKTKFAGLFNKCAPVAGLLSAEKARDVFVKSRLSTDKLSAIWVLADTKNRGALDVADFSVAMALIQASMAGTLTFIPTSLPPGLYEQASTLLSTPAQSAPAASRLPPQAPAPQAQFPPPPAAPPATATWDVSPADKLSSDGFFDTLDTSRLGYIEGDVAVPFMVQSGLSADVLGQIWDLADLNNDGRLTRDGFAVAMHLIQSKLAGKPIPTTLPASLIPPSMRKSQPFSNSPFAPRQPAFAPQQSLPPPEPERNLLLDDSPPRVNASLPQTAILQPQQTGSILNPPRSTVVSPALVASPSIFASPPLSPRDPFGTSTSTVFPPPQAAAPAAPSVFARNILDEDDGPALQDRSAEVGNVTNQLTSMNKSLDTVKTERANLEEQLASQAAQLEALQTQLAAAKAAHSTESNLLTALLERQAGQAADIRLARENLIRAESDLSAVRVEKDEIGSSVLRDKEEIRGLQARLKEVTAQLEQEKASVEVVKKETKQQKGLLAIAKKQVAVKEAEKKKFEEDKLVHERGLAAAKAEAEQAERDLEAIKAEHAAAQAAAATAAAAVTAAAVTEVKSAEPVVPEPEVTNAAVAAPLPPSPPITSPASTKSTNPFDRVRQDSNTPVSFQNASPFSSFVEIPSSTPADPDPFGFEKVEAVTDADVEAAAATVPLLDTKTETVTQASPTPTPSTSNSDNFHTPPTSAMPGAFSDEPSATPASEEPAGLPVQTSNPSLFATGAPAVSGLPEQDTDLNAKLNDLDVDESDSDSDDEPLAVVQDKIKSNGSAGPTSFDEVMGTTDTALPDATPRPSFATVKPEAPVDAFGAPILSPTITAPPSGTNGVSAFDEAMGTIPAGSAFTAAPAARESLSFDAAFDDNFDFATASASFPSATSAESDIQAASPTANVHNIFASNTAAPIIGSASPAQPSFDEVFAPSASTSAPAKNTSARPTSAALGISFDEAFGGSDPAQTLGLGLGNDMEASKASTTASSNLRATPSQSSRVESIRSISPTRPETPPSPKASKSGKAAAGTEKEKTKERSRMSIRLPFRRKKDKQQLPDDAPPVPSSHLAPLGENEAAITPAVEDDMDAVKQLCSMGFSRGQVIPALERYGYDVQKALNYLIGQ